MYYGGERLLEPAEDDASSPLPLEEYGIKESVPYPIAAAKEYGTSMASSGISTKFIYEATAISLLAEDGTRRDT